MKIKDIKIDPIRQKALEYAKANGKNEEELLVNAFTWDLTKEGEYFWVHIHDDNPADFMELDCNYFEIASQIAHEYDTTNTIETLHQSLKIINIEIHPDLLTKVAKMYDIIKVKGASITLEEIFKCK